MTMTRHVLILRHRDAAWRDAHAALFDTTELDQALAVAREPYGELVPCLLPPDDPTGPDDAVSDVLRWFAEDRRALLGQMILARPEQAAPLPKAWESWWTKVRARHLSR